MKEMSCYPVLRNFLRFLLLLSFSPSSLYYPFGTICFAIWELLCRSSDTLSTTFHHFIICLTLGGISLVVFSSFVVEFIIFANSFGKHLLF